MFDVIICTVNTGRVQHKLFDTHAEAMRYVDDFIALKNATTKVGSLGYRVIVNQIEIPAVRSVESLAEAA